MTGNTNQIDPMDYFKEWIQRSGKAQLDFMRVFGEMMSRTNQTNPLETLKEIADKSARTQTDYLQNAADSGSKALSSWLSFAQNLPQFTSWGAFKTTVGSNGRISIPEAEREAIGIKENDLVQVIVVPIHKYSSRQEVKK